MLRVARRDMVHWTKRQPFWRQQSPKTVASGARGGGMFTVSRVLLARDILRNTLAETPSGYVQDPRVYPSRLVDYAKPQETSRLSQTILAALQMEEELKERRELAYEGYTTMRIQACKAILLNENASKESLQDVAQRLETERQRMAALVGKEAPIPLPVEEVVRQRLQAYRGELEQAERHLASSYILQNETTQKKRDDFEVVLNEDGSERFVFHSNSESQNNNPHALLSGDLQDHSMVATVRDTDEYIQAIEAEIEAIRRDGVAAAALKSASSSSSNLEEDHHQDAAPTPTTVVTLQDLHHVIYLLSLCYRRLGDTGKAESLALEILCSGDLRNVDAMECLLELYCGLDQPRKIRSLLEFLDRAHRDPKVQAMERDALWAVEQEILRMSRMEQEEGAREHAGKSGTEGEVSTSAASLPPLHATAAATPSEMALAMLADLVVESAAEHCAREGEGATSRFLLQALGPIVEAIGRDESAAKPLPALPLPEGCTLGILVKEPVLETTPRSCDPDKRGEEAAEDHRRSQGSSYVPVFMEALYRILDDQCATAKAAAAAAAAAGGMSGEGGGGGGLALHQNPSVGRFGEEDIEAFLARVQRSRLEANLRLHYDPNQDSTRGPRNGRQRGGGAEDKKKATENEDGDGEAEAGVPERSTLESVESLQQRRVEAGEKITFTLVISFFKLSLQRQLYSLTLSPSHYHFLTLHRLYEALRHMQRRHESYRIFQELESFFRPYASGGARGASLHKPASSAAREQQQQQPPAQEARKAPQHEEQEHQKQDPASPASSVLFPTPQHLSDFKDAYFTYLSDRVLELSAMGNSTRSHHRDNNGLHLVLQGMERYPDSAVPWVLLSLLLHQEGEVRDAILAAQRAVQIEPLHLNAIFTLANLYKITKGCQALSLRMLDRYKLLHLLLQQGATEEDLAGTLDEIRALSTVKSLHRARVSGADDSGEKKDVQESEEEGEGEEEDADVVMDRALEEFYARLQQAQTYSMPIDAAPRHFAKPPVLVPSAEQDITRDRPPLMNVPIS